MGKRLQSKCFLEIPVKFDIALLSSHSVGGGYYRHALARNMPRTGLAPAFIDVPLDYRTFIDSALAHYEWQEHNVCDFDNSEGIRFAPLAEFKRLLQRDCLMINVVRDPILKFCSIANFYSRYGLWEECNEGKRLFPFSEEEVIRTFYTRFSDNQMALPYLRLHPLAGNLLFLDSEDLRQDTAPKTLLTLFRLLGIREPVPEIKFMRIDSYEDKFFLEYWFPVIVNGRCYRCRMSRELPSHTSLHIQTHPEENLGLLYLYTVEPVLPEDEQALPEACRQAFAEKLPAIQDCYFRFMSRKVTPGRLLEILARHPAFYDAFRFSLQDDVSYIMARYPKVNAYWKELAKLDENSPRSECAPSPGQAGFFSPPFLPAQADQLASPSGDAGDAEGAERGEYSVALEGSAFLSDDWSEITPRLTVAALNTNPKLLLPPSPMDTQVTLAFRSSAAGQLLVSQENNECARVALDEETVTFSLPASLKKRILTLSLESDCAVIVFELAAIRLTALSENGKA